MAVLRLVGWSVSSPLSAAAVGSTSVKGWARDKHAQSVRREGGEGGRVRQRVPSQNKTGGNSFERPYILKP